MPGVDVEKDILNVIKIPIVIPENGPTVVDDSIVTGKNFKLEFEK
jgi:acyl CoA:acetate/3-ketoacid CoA transferase